MPHTTTATDNTSTDTSVKGYSTIAGELPTPTQEPNPVRDDQPALADVYTIPNGDIPTSAHPWNNNDRMTWRQWRAKYTTTTALFTLAKRHVADDDIDTVHAMVSPPQDSVHDSHTSVRDWRQRTTEIAQNHGFAGGVAVFHGFRVQSEIASEFRDYVEQTRYAETASDVLLWEWIRAQGNWRDYVEWGPHFHIIGVTKSNTAGNGFGGIAETSGPGYVLQTLRKFQPYTGIKETNAAIAEHRAVAKDMMDHVTFASPDADIEPDAPFTWFGTMQGSRPSSAKQPVTDTTLDALREILINGPANPDAITEPSAGDIGTTSTDDTATTVPTPGT